MSSYMWHLYYIVNSMNADDLATQGARPSAAMVLTYFSQNIPISAPEVFICFDVIKFQCERRYCCCIQVAKPLSRDISDIIILHLNGSISIEKRDRWKQNIINAYCVISLLKLLPNVHVAALLPLGDNLFVIISEYIDPSSVRKYSKHANYMRINFLSYI